MSLSLLSLKLTSANALIEISSCLAQWVCSMPLLQMVGGSQGSYFYP